ncbi:MAG: potassium channel family protein [Halioglobus sp.]|nr:potassium channel family protein [Halioglobus sp.]
MGIVYLINMFVVGIVVCLHYEVLHRINILTPLLPQRHRLRIVLGVLIVLAAHAIEMWLFGIVYYLMNKADDWGYLAGNFNGELLDCVYFSFTAYTSLGFGDIVPHGDLRFLAALEALTGLVLITWTASFLYLRMTKDWNME